MDEKLAITRLKLGDLKGLEFLVEQYQVQAVHAAYLITGDRFLAEEMVQAVFLKLAGKIDQFDVRQSFRPWFFRIIVNDAIKAAKRQSRYVSLDTLSESVLSWLNDPSQRPEALTEIKELRDAVWKAIQSLSPEQRAVIVQRHFLEMDEAEMVKELQRPASTVKWWLKGRFFLKPGDNALVWSEEGREQRLAWSEGTRWYLIEFWPNLNMAGTMGKDQIIHLAESLVASSVEIVDPLNPSRLLSISDAEKISGLDLKAPTLLPIDMDFSYARYLPDERQVHLIYGLNEELVIHEWKGNPVKYKKPLGKYEFTCEIASMSGDEAFYCFFEGPNPRSFLWWHKVGINYQMYFDSYSLGGQLDREKMLLIAESMQDVDDFTKNNAKNYEQLVLYEQALEIDAKKFSEAPAGWTFDYVWSNAHLQCVGLVYTSTTGQAALSISQCKTENFSETSVFPLRSIERVKVGNSRGQFITGGFVVTDDGKQIWDMDSPRKQLYWQEDGVWFQIVLSGDSVMLYDKEELISIAESLR